MTELLPLTPDMSLEAPSLVEEPEKETLVVPGLIRMVLIDSVRPGSNLEMPLDGHVLVTGENASGKTSWIQLVPLFFGESPNRIVPKNETKKFIPYYLPRTTSYIAFEYRHRSGGLRSVIIHASSEGEALRFRLVRSGLFADMFETDDGEYVEAVNLARHMRGRGYEISERQIDTMREYRAIIQGVRLNDSSQERRRFMAMMTADYAFPQAGQSLANIERVISGMLKKNGSLRELEGMIADRILGDERDIRLSADHRRMESWPLQFRAYQDVMKMEERTRGLGADCMLLSEIQARIGAAFEEIRLIQARDEAKLKEVLQEKSGLQELLKTEEDAYATAYDLLQAAIVTLRVESEDLEKKVKSIEDQERYFAGQGVSEKAELARRRAEFEEERSALRSRIDALTAGSEALVAAYARLEDSAREESAARQEDIARENEQIRDRLDVDAEALRAAQGQRLANLRAEKSSDIAAAEELRDTAVQRHSEAKARVASPFIDASLTEALEAAQDAVGQRHDALQLAQQDAAPLHDTVRRARQASEDVLRRKTELIARKMRSEESLELALTRMKPPAGSLLAWLREQMPDSWGSSIGRVIRDDLLSRSDLNPALVDEGTTICGVSLDLTRLDPNPASDQSAEEARIAEIRDMIAGLEEEIRSAEKADRQAAEARALAERALSEQDARVQSAKNHLDASRRTLAERKADVEAARQRSKDAAGAELALASQAKELADKALSRAREALRLEVAEQEALDREDLDLLKQDCEAKLSENRRRSGEERTALAARLAELRAEQDRARTENGIDPAEIRALEDRLAEVEARLSEIRRNADILAAWVHFRDTEQKDLPILRIQAAEKRKALGARQDEQSDLKTAWSSRKGEIARRMSGLDIQMGSLKKDIELAEKRLLAADGYPRLSLTAITRRLEEIIAELNRDIAQEAEQKRSIEQEVRRIASRFRDSAGSPPETYLSEAVRSLGREGPDWVPALLHWFDEAHASHRDALLLEARAMANGIKSTYQRLNRLDREIQTTNQRLQRSLNRSLAFDVVSDIGITISSTVQELDYYPAIRRLSEVHEAWVESGEALPPEHFAQAMETMLGFLRQGRGAETDLRSQIRLRGYVVENGMRRDFTSSTDLSQVSSNGVSYLVLMIIFLGFVNMARGDKPLQMVWALDELSNIDASNTSRLLRLLKDNGITLIAATPDSSAEVRRQFDFRVKAMKDRSLTYIEGATPRQLGLAWSAQEGRRPDLTSGSDAEGEI